ncbi:MAG TPA: magnesium transporter [Candidatus Excrementavichristensenella intestinipullorum]|nr:magnesium transporter [Candidatus Excrementavichristensenella intestinipullorum]
MKSRLDHLLESQRHGELRGALMMLNEVDIAEYMQTLDKDKLLMVFRILPKDISSDVFAYMDNDQRQTLIESIGDTEVAKLVDDMFIDDAVDFLEELPAGVVKRVLQNTDVKRRNLINQFLRYPENSAGSIMTIEYCEFHTGITVSQAMAELKRTGIDKETIYTLYIIDDQRHLVGIVPLRKMILADDSTLVDALMDTGVISVTTLDDQETVAESVRKYDLMSIPVVDTEGRLVGIITVDDIVDVIEEENTEDFEKMAALVPSDSEYLKTSPFKLALNRIPWLLVLMVSAMFTGGIITSFEGLLNSSAVGIILTSCIPMMMDTGGNCGSQVSTLVIRGMALGEIEFRDLPRVLWKELRVAVLVGAILALVNFVRLLAFGGAGITPIISFVVAISMFATVLFAKTIGAVLPMVAKKAHLDPALMASPLITTIVDACSLTILFSIATALLTF